ncbi:MAG: hypothetical protein ACK41D_04100 [Rubricoccaceae bacterium]
MNRLRFFLAPATSLVATLVAALVLGGCRATLPQDVSVRGPSAEITDGCFDLRVLPAADRAYADSLLGAALDREALYTYAAPIKPISSVAMLRLPVARPDSVPEGAREQARAAPGAQAAAERFYRVAAALRCGPVETVVVPYRAAFGSERALQMTAVRRDRLDEILARDAPFWLQFGIVPGADAHLVVSVVEHAAAADRWRGYGYLFGYPEHAITFFVEAGREGMVTGEIVPRDFFHIPVHVRESGHFTYAVPRGYTPTETDSVLYRHGTAVLAEYRARRAAFLRPDSTLRAADLLRAWAAGPARP